MATMQAGRTEGFWLSVPAIEGGRILNQLADATTWTEATEDADLAGLESFVLAGYEDSETVYATLYQIGADGGLVRSECYPISGPEAE